MGGTVNKIPELKELQQTPSNLKPRTRGNKRSKGEQLRVMNDIFILSANHNDNQIMETLSMPNSTYYMYKSRMYTEAKKIWDQVCKESLEYRALHLVNSINLALKVNQEIALDQNQTAKDRLEAAELLVSQQLTLLKLIRDGPGFVSHQSD